MALLIVLERLSPAERTAFVLHDIFGCSFEQAAEATDRTARPGAVTVLIGHSLGGTVAPRIAVPRRREPSLRSPIDG